MIVPSPPALSASTPSGLARDEGWECTLISSEKNVWLPVRMNLQGLVECLALDVGGWNEGQCQWATGMHPYTCDGPGKVVVKPEDIPRIVPRVGNSSCHVPPGTWEYAAYRAYGHLRKCKPTFTVSKYLPDCATFKKIGS